MNKRVLVIDDDLNVCRDIKQVLDNATTDVNYALSTADALKLVRKYQYCLVIMDIHLSETDGTDLLKAIRQALPIPILVLSTKASAAERISILQAGANVCMEKPYDSAECLAQAQSLIQLYLTSNANVTESCCYTLWPSIDLKIDPAYRRVVLKGKPLHLTRKEFDLLYCLALYEGKVLSREQLYNLVWHDDCDCYINVEATIKSHLSSIRKKLNTGGKEYIQTVWGVGYRFDPGSAH